MKSQRGAANLRRFNAEREDRNVHRIEEELKRARRLKIEFRSLGKLVEYISGATLLHRSSLTRNVRYKTMLTDFLFRMGGALDKIPDSKASPEILRAKLIAARLESSNLKKQVKRLEASLGNAALVARDADGSHLPSSGKDYLDFIDTAMALTALLERMQDTVTVDMKKKTIEDLAAPPSKRVIVGPERATVYVNWLRNQKGLPLSVGNDS